MLKQLSGFLTDNFRGLITLVTIALAAWWLGIIALRLGVPPVKDGSGNIVIDEYQRAKDILLVVLPLVTTTFGFWFGAQGKDQAQAQADQAHQQLTAVVAASTDPDILQKAKTSSPHAFPESTRSSGSG